MFSFSTVMDIFRRKMRTGKPLRYPEYESRYRMTLREWLVFHQKEIVFDKATWMGVPIWKNPLDAWVYQEILHEIRPEILIEIGSANGGSTKFFADLFELLGSGHVISIDINRANYSLKHDRVTALTGDSTSREIVDQVERLCRGKKTMVIQDGAHHKDPALADLLHYAPMVSVGSYFIMEDGIVDLFHPGDSLGFDTPGPLAAVEEFLRDHPNFVIDASRERYLLTYNPRGFLKRIA